ncbi:hypothetical protein ACFSUK_12240 [Sphingobium scionense]
MFGHFQDALTAFEAANDDIAITLDLSVQSAVDAARAIESLRADIAYFYALEEPVACRPAMAGRNRSTSMPGRTIRWRARAACRAAT